MTAVCIVEFELRYKTVWRREEMHSDPSQAAAIPTVAQQCAYYVVAIDQHRGHIVGLIQDALAILGKIGCQDIAAHLATVQKYAVAAEGRHIEPRASYVFRECERFPQVRGGLRQYSGIPESFVG